MWGACKCARELNSPLPLPHTPANCSSNGIQPANSLGRGHALVLAEANGSQPFMVYGEEGEGRWSSGGGHLSDGDRSPSPRVSAQLSYNASVGPQLLSVTVRRVCSRVRVSDPCRTAPYHTLSPRWSIPSPRRILLSLPLGAPATVPRRCRLSFQSRRFAEMSPPRLARARQG